MPPCMFTPQGRWHYDLTSARNRSTMNSGVLEGTNIVQGMLSFLLAYAAANPAFPPEEHITLFLPAFFSCKQKDYADFQQQKHCLYCRCCLTFFSSQYFLITTNHRLKIVIILLLFLLFWKHL